MNAWLEQVRRAPGDWLELLRTAQTEKSWSVQKLLTESGLDLERSTLQRKLSGNVGITFPEYAALSKALDVVLEWPKGKRRTRAA